MSKLRRYGLVLILLGALTVGGCFLFPNLPPEAAFIVNYNTVPGEPLVVVLDASASSSPDGDEIEAYMWTFGDDCSVGSGNCSTASRASVCWTGKPQRC